MTKNLIKIIIKQSAVINYNSYKRSWLNGDYDAVELAKKYWHNRTQQEAKADEAASVTLDDYQQWCSDAIDEAMDNDDDAYNYDVDDDI